MAEAQSNVPFPNDSSIWNVVEYGYGTLPPETGTWHYGLKGDTLIDNLNYHQLHVNSGALGWVNPEGDFNPNTAFYFAAKREDANKKNLYQEAKRYN